MIKASFAVAASGLVLPVFSHAQASAAPLWETVLRGIAKPGVQVWLADRALGPNEFWTATGARYDSVWMMSLKERGIVSGWCQSEACPRNSGTISVLLEPPIPIADDRASVRAVVRIGLDFEHRVPCADTTVVVREAVTDAEAFLYVLDVRDGRWLLTGRRPIGSGHTADSLTRVRVAACRKGG